MPSKKKLSTKVLQIKPRKDWLQPDGGRTLDKTDLYKRLGLIKSGQTLEQALARGVTRRDVRIAARRGWLQVIEHAE